MPDTQHAPPGSRRIPDASTDLSGRRTDPPGAHSPQRLGRPLLRELARSQIVGSHHAAKHDRSADRSARLAGVVPAMAAHRADVDTVRARSIWDGPPRWSWRMVAEWSSRSGRGRIGSPVASPCRWHCSTPASRARNHWWARRRSGTAALRRRRRMPSMSAGLTERRTPFRRLHPHRRGWDGTTTETASGRSRTTWTSTSTRRATQHGSTTSAGVPPSTAEDATKAYSVGAFLNENVKGRYDHKYLSS